MARSIGTVSLTLDDQVHGSRPRPNDARQKLEDLYVEPFERDDEVFLQIPSRTGLGFKIDRDKLAKFRR